MSKNIIAHDFQIKRSDKERQNGHKAAAFWLCGLSGSGKSTIANLAQKTLFEQKRQVVILDGDDVRNGLCKDLGFDQSDRMENLRRVAEVAKLFANNGSIVLCCFITPLEKQRKLASQILEDDFKLVYVKTDLDTCESRDPKGLYKMARKGEIKNFTGISSAFEEPKDARIVLDTCVLGPEEAAELLCLAVES